jgi:hypothetical protein
LDQQALKIQLPQQVLENGTLVDFTGGVAGLSDSHAQGFGVQRHLVDERRTAATRSLSRIEPLTVIN